MWKQVLEQDIYIRPVSYTHLIVDSYAASCKEDSKIPKIISNMCEISKAYNPSASDDILLLRELYSLFHALIEEFPKEFEYKIRSFPSSIAFDMFGK